MSRTSLRLNGNISNGEGKKEKQQRPVLGEEWAENEAFTPCKHKRMLYDRTQTDQAVQFHPICSQVSPVAISIAFNSSICLSIFAKNRSITVAHKSISDLLPKHNAAERTWVVGGRLDRRWIKPSTYTLCIVAKRLFHCGRYRLHAHQTLNHRAREISTEICTHCTIYVIIFKLSASLKQCRTCCAENFNYKILFNEFTLP